MWTGKIFLQIEQLVSTCTTTSLGHLQGKRGLLSFTRQQMGCHKLIAATLFYIDQELRRQRHGGGRDGLPPPCQEAAIQQLFILIILPIVTLIVCIVVTVTLVSSVPIACFFSTVLKLCSLRIIRTCGCFSFCLNILIIRLACTCMLTSQRCKVVYALRATDIATPFEFVPSLPGRCS